VARVEAAQLLTAFLDTLDDDKRETFILAELEQMTVPEIAEAVDANVNTVYSRLRAARKAFEQTVSRIRARDEHHLAAAKGIR
jgi:RNA polymerase sigma-70 factor (ECF subfamily)